jgi:hypothetical protein
LSCPQGRPSSNPRRQNLRHPGESRGPVFSFRASGASWIPACAGMTSDCAHSLCPLLRTVLNSPHPSSMRTRAADRLYLGTWDAAPEENRDGERAMPKGSGSSLRGRGNGPPQGLVCPPPGLESPGPSLPAAFEPPAEETVSEGKGLEHIAAKRGAGRLPTKERKRPFGAPQSSLRGGRCSLTCSRATRRRGDETRLSGATNSRSPLVGEHANPKGFAVRGKRRTRLAWKPRRKD